MKQPSRIGAARRSLQTARVAVGVAAASIGLSAGAAPGVQSSGS